MAFKSFSQEGINTVTPVSSAELEVYSITKSIILPILTDAPIKAISSPETVLIIYNITSRTYYYNNGTLCAKTGTKDINVQDGDADTTL